MRLAVPPVTEWRGLVHYVSDQIMVGSRGGTIYVGHDASGEMVPVLQLRPRWQGRVAARSLLLSRLLRVGIHHVVPLGDGRWAAFGFGHVYEFGLNEGEVLGEPLPYVGSRPLVPCVRDGALYYGEYQNNKRRDPVSVFVKRPDSRQFDVAHQFEAVRHIHGVFADPWSGALFATTGDLNHECAIWRTDDDFRTLHAVVRGSQQARVVGLLFTKDYLYFGTDTPQEQNYIYRLSRAGRNPERLQAVQGSVFYGCHAAGGLLFGTVCEPSAVNTDRYSRVWWSKDGTNWSELAAFKKDCLPSKLFQYGQTMFPAGPGSGRYAWMTPFATEHGHRSLCFDLGFE